MNNTDLEKALIVHELSKAREGLVPKKIKMRTKSGKEVETTRMVKPDKGPASPREKAGQAKGLSRLSISALSHEYSKTQGSRNVALHLKDAAKAEKHKGRMASIAAEFRRRRPEVVAGKRPEVGKSVKVEDVVSGWGKIDKAKVNPTKTKRQMAEYHEAVTAMKDLKGMPDAELKRTHKSLTDSKKYYQALGVGQEEMAKHYVEKIDVTPPGGESTDRFHAVLDKFQEAHFPEAEGGKYAGLGRGYGNPHYLQDQARYHMMRAGKEMKRRGLTGS